MTPARRRGLVLLALALACGGLAASRVAGTIRSVESRTGKPVAVLVAARDVAPSAEIQPGDLALREVPARYVPADALRRADDAAGARPPVGLTRGAYVTASALGGAAARAGGAGVALRRGERAIELPVTGGTPLGDAGPGTRVDVLVSTEPRDGEGRSFIALENVELLALSGAGAGSGGVGGASSGGEGSGSDGAGGSGGSGGSPAVTAGDEPAATATATLRVSLREAVYLTAAQNFAREVRLVPRPPGDRGSAGRAAVAVGDL